jgi:hypothetical protein
LHRLCMAVRDVRYGDGGGFGLQGPATPGVEPWRPPCRRPASGSGGSRSARLSTTSPTAARCLPAPTRYVRGRLPGPHRTPLFTKLTAEAGWNGATYEQWLAGIYRQWLAGSTGSGRPRPTRSGWPGSTSSGGPRPTSGGWPRSLPAVAGRDLPAVAGRDADRRPAVNRGRPPSPRDRLAEWVTSTGDDRQSAFRVSCR